MKKLKIVLLIATLLPVQQAYSFNVIGEWLDKNSHLIVTAKGNAYYAKLVTTVDVCSGDVEGDAVLTGSVLKITPKDPDNDSICTINIKFSGEKASIEEVDDCGFYHGASCYFQGNLRKRK